MPIRVSQLKYSSTKTARDLDLKQHNLWTRLKRLDELISLRKIHCFFTCRFYFNYADQEATDFIILPEAGIEVISGKFIPLT